MTPLIDGDILRYEAGSIAEYGLDEVPNFIVAEEFLNRRIDEICAAVGATQPPVIYLTGKGNFREDIAKAKVYKGNRKDVKKPYHFRNLTVYLKAVYGAIVVDGMEADDALCIHQTLHLEQRDTVICTRDKDLRQCPGWHYGWESGKQPEFRLRWVEGIGDIELSANKKSVKGWGDKFFYAQLLIGDTVDNIPGCPKVGPVKAYKLLSDAQTIEEMYRIVLDEYSNIYAENASEELREQAYLLWMVRELNEDGSPVMWREPYE